MKKIVIATFLATATATSAMAADNTSQHAKAVDKPAKTFEVATLTCGEFLQMSAPEAVTTLSWIDGYLTQQTGQPVWDVETFIQHRDKLINICVDESGKDKLVLEEVKNLK